MASGKWQVASGKWQVASGKWQVASGKWQVASGKWQVARRSMGSLDEFLNPTNEEGTLRSPLEA
ncbi:hypothetical protein F1602_17875 [Pseudomonas putida]|nr:hypothetical protein F1602_17875 [Pseudomonas putida]